MYLTVILGVVGTVLSIAGLAVDIVDYANPKWLRRRLILVCRRLRLEYLLGPLARTEAAINPLPVVRQLLLVFGAAVLTILTLVNDSKVYLALEGLLTASGLLWFISISAKRPAVDKMIAGGRLALTFGVLVILLLAEAVSGIHWAGVIGLELLGIGFALTGRFWRDLLILAGSAALVAYAVLGLLFDAPQQQALHAIWLALNVSFGAFAAIVFVQGLSKK